MSKVRWGIIGAGRIANTFCNDVKFIDNAEVVAVAARQQDDAMAFALDHDIARFYGGYQALFEDADLDAVYIATPHTFHFEQAKQALKARKHVLCEKPFTVSAEQCQQLIELAQKQNRFLMEGMWTYFLPAIQQAKQWLEQGRIGKLLHIKADFGYPLAYDPKAREFDAKLAGGCLLEMGIYPLTFAWLFANNFPDTMQLTSHLADNGVEDDVQILAHYSNDLTANLATSFRAKLPNIAYLVGDKGYIEIPDFFRARECKLFELEQCIEHAEFERESFGFEHEIRHACECILNRETQSDIMPLSISLALQQQMQDILQNIKSRAK